MQEKIAELINTNQYEEAKQLIAQEREKNTYDDSLAVLEAEIYSRQGNREKMFAAIADGLRCNYANYELFYMLGIYYEPVNPYQAFLCYENAEFYCRENADDLAVIAAEKERLRADGISVPGYSVVILSYNAKEKMQLCLESLRRYAASSVCEIIVVDNASTDGVTEYLKEQTDIVLICNSENRGFPAGCNQGIKAAQPYHDIFLLNNDTILTPNAVFWLRMGLYEQETVGAAGSVSNFCANYQQIAEPLNSWEECLAYACRSNLPMKFPYESRLRLIGFALFLKRTALDAVGLLDERFSPGNYEDDDLSLRLLSAGYRLLLCKNSFIYHFGHSSFAKDGQKFSALLRKNGEKLYQKWGFHFSYYYNMRKELTAFIENDRTDAIRVLEVGCGMGGTLGHIKNTWVNANVCGIELEQEIARLGAKYLPSIVQGNIETMELEYPPESFDYIIFGDVLEHLYDPKKVLLKMKKYLKPEGCFLVSLPNLMHWSVLLELLKGRFSYQESGILDRTHLRFFTLSEIEKLFAECGCRIVQTAGSSVGMAMTPENAALYQAVTELPGVANEQEFQIYQYLLKVQK